MRPGRGQDSRGEPRTSPPCAPRTVGVRRDTTELLSRPRPAGSFHRARRRAGSALDRWGEAPAKRQTRGLARRRAPPVRPGAHGGGEKRGRHHRKKFGKKKPGRSQSPAEPPHEATVTEHGDRPRHGPLFRLPLAGDAASRSALQGTKAPESLRRPSRGRRVFRLIVSDPQTGVAPGWTRGRKVRSKCR